MKHFQSPDVRWRLALLAMLCGKLSAATLELVIRPVFNGEPLILDSLRHKTCAKETFSVTRLSFLLSDVALERADGRWVELPGTLAWYDFATRRNAFTITNVPPDTYRALRFHIGPDAAMNAAEVASFPAQHPLNPNLNGLHWTWQGGYIFLAAEGLYRSTNDELRGWSYHFARDPNRTRINLAAPIEVNDGVHLDIVLDLATLLHVPRPLSFERDGSATHSREGDPIAASLAANLPGAFRVQRIVAASGGEPGAGPPRAQPLNLPEHFTPYRFAMPATFPIPELPRDNPLTVERVRLGERLFNESALSRDGTISCASCHRAAFAFSDPRRFSPGVSGRSGVRNAQSLANLAWKSSFFWDGRAPTLRAQALIPVEDHLEMDDTVTNVCAKLTALPDYPALFAAAFGSREITPEKLGLAVEAFVLTLTSFDSRFDRALRGEAELTAEEKRGFELFMTEHEPRTGQRGADCFHCHGGPLFTDHQFHNNGLDAEPIDAGREKVTGRAADRGKFSTPTLRNVALTAPYMHDGRFNTLEEVVDHYRRGVKRSPTLDPNLAKHPGGGVPLADDDARALVAFLTALSTTEPAQILSGSPP